MPPLRLLLPLTVVCASLIPGLSPAQVHDESTGTTQYADGHPPEMLRAIERARASLPAVLDMARTGSYSYTQSLSLKVSIPIPEGHENIWIDQIRKTDNGFSGQLANEPVHIKGKRFGSYVGFYQSQVIDWSLTSEDGRFFGHLTTRVMLSSMSADASQSIRDMLTRDPFPKGVN